MAELSAVGYTYRQNAWMWRCKMRHAATLQQNALNSQ